MNKVLSVHLLLFWGQATYDENQKITSKTSPIQLNHGSLEWENFMKHLKANGITKATVQNVYDLSKKEGDKYEEVDDFSAIQEEVDSHLKTPEKELTAEQKQIQELQKKVDELTKPKDVNQENGLSPEIQKQLADYEALKAQIEFDKKNSTAILDKEGVIVENQTPAAKIAETIKNNPKASVSEAVKTAKENTKTAEAK